MKRVSKVLAAVSVALLSVGAHAEVVKYRYTAKVSTVSEYDPATGTITQLSGSDFAGTPVAIGDTISGLFQYDTAVGLSDYQPTQQPGSVDRSYNAGATDFISYLDHDTSLAFASMPTMNWLGSTFVQDSVPVPGAFASDNFFMERYEQDDVFFKGAIIFLDDLYGNAFDTADMPAALDPSAFQYGSVDGSFMRTSDFNFMSFSADMTALERVAVPEPGSALLFAVAGAMLLGVRRRRA